MAIGLARAREDLELAGASPASLLECLEHPPEQRNVLCPRGPAVLRRPDGWRLSLYCARAWPMPSTGKPDDLTQEELVRVQTAIDAGTIWATVGGGKFAMKLITNKKCHLAPGVVMMWLRDDDRYEPLYSQEEANRRTALLIKELPETVRAVKEATAETAFLKEHEGDLVTLETEAAVSSRAIDPWLLAVLFGGLATLVSWLAGLPVWLGLVVAAFAFVVQQRRGERLRSETTARVNELRVKEGLPPKRSPEDDQATSRSK